MNTVEFPQACGLSLECGYCIIQNKLVQVVLYFYMQCNTVSLRRLACIFIDSSGKPIFYFNVVKCFLY